MSIIESHKNHDPRLRVFYFIIGAFVLVLVAGLAYRQILQEHVFAEREKIQNLRRVLVPGPRGNIYDRNGELLVANRPRYSAVVYLSELRTEFRREAIRLMREARQTGITYTGNTLETTARANVAQRYLDEVNQILERDMKVDSRRLERHFHAQRILPFPLAGDLTSDQFARLIEQIPKESPIQIHGSSARHYPFGSGASHTLGYVTSTLEISEQGVPGEDLMTFNIRGSSGRTGIELLFDSLLQGETGGEIWVVDPMGFQYELVERKFPLKGNDIVTSLDIRLQQVAERSLRDRTGAIAVIEVHSGEVLALVSKPDYDLNDLSPNISQAVAARIEEQGAWMNRAHQGLYPPGSTFKLVTALAALRRGVITPDTVFACNGSHRVGNRNFPCHNRSGHGDLDLRDALRVSCNVYFYKAGLEAGIHAIADEARRFHLDQPTGIDLPFETRRMIVPDPQWKREREGVGWWDGDTANVSIGQGYLLVTPLQMAAFTASLARGETRTVPTLLHRKSTLSERNDGRRAAPIDLPDELYRSIIAGMEDAADRGTARFLRLTGIPTAAKTGTSQVRTPQGTLHLAWIAAFAPVEDPEIAIVVMVEGTLPGEGYAGGTTAAPIARDIIEHYFRDRPGDAGPIVQSR